MIDQVEITNDMRLGIFWSRLKKKLALVFEIA